MASRRKKSFTIPVAVALGFAPLVARGINLTIENGFKNGVQLLTTSLIPYNFQTRKIDTSGLSQGLYPILAGLAVHKVVGSMLGVNRMLARSGIPWVRI